MNGSNMNGLVKWLSLAVLAFMIICGLVMVFWEVHPFFLDEWAVIYNLKYHTSEELWGQLDKVQQFPRVYLHIVQWFSSLFDYSYTSLRLPSFIVHCGGLAYSAYLSGRLFPEKPFYRWMWVLIYAAYPTSIFYFTCTKQYTMEMFMGLVGIAQLVLLLNLNSSKNISGGKYALLCLSFLIAPLFSFTYPVVAAPLFGLVFLNQIGKGQNMGKQWLALVCCLAGVIALYFIDIKYVMADQGMKDYWKDYYMTNGFNFKELLYHIYLYFYLFGRGGVLMVVVAVVGLSAWLYGTYRSVLILKHREKSIMEWLVLYSVALIWLSILLFIMGKLPLNAHRLNAYKTPAAATLIIYMFLQFHKRFVLIISAVAAGVFGLQVLFIVQPMIREFTDAEHKKKMRIYNNGKTAITLAQQDNIPVFTTSMTLYPHAHVSQADWVIKCYPLYKKDPGIPVYPIENGDAADALLQMLQYNSAVVTTGDSVFVITK